MRNDLSRRARNGAIGFLVGLAVWGGLSAPYTRLLASLSGAAIRMFERPAVTTITPQGTLMAVDRSDIPFSPSSPRFAVESTDITFNFILLITLFAASGRVVSDRNVFGFAGAALVLVIVHVAAVVSFVESYYVEAFGAWGASRDGIVRHFWGAAPYFYGMIGVYGAAVALWWLFRPSAQPAAEEPSRARGTLRSSHRARA